MMARVYSNIAKFKRVEASFREAANAWPKAIKEIDEAMSGRRTNAELATLTWLRDQCVRFRQESIDLMGQFYDRVDAKAH